MATLKQQLANTQAQVASEQQQTLPSSKVVTMQPSRSYVSSGAAFDGDNGFDSPFVKTNTTFRPSWRTQDSAIQQNKVTTTNLPKAVTATGVAVSPVRTSSVLAAVPDMSVAVNAPAGTQVQVSWNFSGSLSTATASASFVLYRDNVRIGTQQYGNSGVNNGKFSVSQNYIDAPSKGLHSYSVYWATTAGTLTADGKSRAIIALTLKPQ